ncbi:MAG: type I glutamate--ammonia ligase [Bacilli bacterium]
MDKNTIKEICEKEEVKYIRLQFCDMLGTIKAVEIPISKLDDALDNNINFDGSSVEGFVRIKEADMVLHPDLSTFMVLSFENSSYGKVARFICDVYKTNGEPFMGDPRYILKREIEKMKEIGYEKFCVGFEPEFYLFKLDEEGNPKLDFVDNASYFDLSPLDGANYVRRDITLELEKLGFTVQTSHHEVGPGQNEINFKYDDVLASCDRVLTFKQVVKTIARKHGYLATFMPKPVQGQAGSGMHTNCSIFSKDGKNLFFDEKDPMKLSMLAKKWITGVLKHSRELALLTNPSVNSYKRLVSGYEAPIYACWSDSNRSALIRIPAGRGLATRAEVRNVDPMANPYLALAGIIAAGLEGVTSLKDDEIIAPIYDNIFSLTEQEIEKLGIIHLPETLHEAVQEFKKSKLLRETLGEHTFTKYLAATEMEWKSYHNSISKWELDRYLRR